MDKAAYWFLDAAIERSVTVRVLDPTDREELETSLNRPTHGLSRSETVEVLYRLAQRGDVWFVDDELFVREDYGSHTISLTRTELEEAIVGTRPGYLAYILTPQGGAQWERVSHPDWNRYIYQSYGIEPDDGEIIGVDRQYIQHHAHVWVLRWEGSVITAGSEQWDELRPWQATYWKILPHAHRLRFLYTSASDVGKEYPLQWDDNDFTYLQWYTNYLEQ